jgi:TonB family protein
MSAKIVICLLAIFAVTAEVIGAKAGSAPADYAADLGVKKTPWGDLHSYDRLRAAKTVPPKYPSDELRSGVTGVVALAVLVGEDGAVADVQVLKTSGNRHFDDAAKTAVRQWKYRPLEPRERFVTIQPITFNIQVD